MVYIDRYIHTYLPFSTPISGEFLPQVDLLEAQVDYRSLYFTCPRAKDAADVLGVPQVPQVPWHRTERERKRIQNAPLFCYLWRSSLRYLKMVFILFSTDEVKAKK